jgi:UDP-glucose 4-epimerase
MRVLVTGGAGYIGSVMAEQLLDHGHQVVVYDDLSHGHRDAVPAGAVFVEGDILDRPRLSALIRRQQTEAVVHMAALTSVAESVARPDAYYRVNVEGSLSLIEAAIGCGVRLFIFSSTAAVYAPAGDNVLDESDRAVPDSAYGETKLAVEHALRWYEGAFEVRWMGLRYFNAAGATRDRGERHQPETHLIPSLLQVAAGQRQDFTVYGTDYPTRDGTAVRDYVHVSDLAHAHVLGLAALHEGMPSRIYNVGQGGRGHTVLEVLDSVRRVTGHPVPVQFGPRRPGDGPFLVASPERIAAELGWRPAHRDLDGIVRSAWNWMRVCGQPVWPAGQALAP